MQLGMIGLGRIGANRRVSDSGEGRWTVQAMRFELGGHHEKPA
jgi:6-phosphogluconate dehydrogenase (decarboxylating)